MKPEDIFHAALEKKTAEERAAYLEGACRGDEPLRAHVENLLKHNEGAQGFLETLFVAPAPPSGASATGAHGPFDPELFEKPGSMIGTYKLLQQIGEGGFGVVYMAEQTQPVRRTVALKIIKVGMDTREVVARFEAERQALAMMEHTNIAKVFEAGATHGGRPYFAMELVRGVPITEYADANQLAPRERLELFVKVCSALQHAHQKGVIHRDIKPSNVLVTLHDGVPVPKVIDFGIAKAMNARLTEKTLFTRYGQFVGTPAYMSPEQAEMSGLDVDTCSDIYSLGVLLYELLTGTTPMDPEALRQAGYAEMQKLIREIEPPKPSTRLSTMKDKLPSVAARRRTEPGKLSALIRGDLDWIVMKCLEKDRTRRYESASGLAADIERHLTGEPVIAAPPSRTYRLRKLVHRNKAFVTAGGIVGLALVLGVVGTTWGMLRAEVRRQDTEQARTAESKQRVATEKALARIEKIHAFIINTLKTADPHESGSQGMLVADAMRRAVAGIEAGRLHDDPETEAKLCSTIAVILNGNGRSADALPIAERALKLHESLHPEGSEDVVTALNDLAMVLSFLGRNADADALNDRALEMQRRVAPGERARIMACLFQCAESRRELARFGEAEKLYQESLDLAQELFMGDDPHVASALAGLATSHEMLGRLADAESLFRKALAMRERLLQSDHPQIADCMAGLARVLNDQGRAAEAEPLARHVLEMRRRLFQTDSPYLAVGLCDLATTLERLGRPGEAVPLYEQALEMRRRLYKTDHPDIARNIQLLGNVHLKMGNAEKAETLFKETLEMSRRLRHTDHVDIVQDLNSLGQTRMKLGRYQEADVMLREAVDMARRLYDEPNPVLAVVLHHLAEVLNVESHHEEALAPGREAVAMYRAHPDWAPWEEAHAETVLAFSLISAKKANDEAAETCRRVVALQRKGYTSSGLKLDSALALLGLTLSKLDSLDAARECETVFRECVAIRSKTMPGNFRLANMQSFLGEAVLSVAVKDSGADAAARRAKLEEARDLLLLGWNGLKDDPNVPTPEQNGGVDTKRDALERILRLYTEWERLEPGKGHAAEAAKWRAQLAAPPARGEGSELK